jgi:hypothetical protein
MLFAKVFEDRWLLIVVYGFGLSMVYNCMPGSTAKGISGGWAGILGEGWSYDAKVDSRMMIAKVDASGMFDWPL